MPCYHPLKGWQIGFHESGKPKYKITSYDVKYLIKSDNNQFIPCYDSIDNDILRPRILDFIEIPCGHCIGCRLKYSTDWAARCLLELKYSDCASFITLTYDNEHLPKPNEIIDSNGVITTSPVNPLVKRDLQLFFKRVRKKFPDKKIRYFAAGEYSPNGRPHYHIILFNLDFTHDRKLWKCQNGFMYYVSEDLKKLWPFGFHIITDVNFETCAYTARYVVKKMKGQESYVYDLYSFPSEFSLASRRPGIGRVYYDENKKDIYDDLKIQLTNGKIVHPPRYYDKLFDIEYPEEMKKIKEDRRIKAIDFEKMKSSLTTLSYLDRLAVEEENLNEKLKACIRKEL